MSRFLLALLLLLILAPVPLLSQPGTPVPPDKAHILVKLPTASARLTIAGDATTQTGELRLFETPSLPAEKGTTYSYELVATWEKDGKPVTAKRVVPLILGRRVLVDFTSEPGDKPKNSDKDKPKVPNRPKVPPSDLYKDLEKLRKPPREKGKERTSRSFTFTYETTVTGLPPGQRAKIWVPVAQTSPDQKVEVIERKLPKEFEKYSSGQEPRYGNEMLFVEGKADAQGKVPLKLVYKVTRYEVKGPESQPGKEDPARVARYLGPDALVPVGGKALALLKDRTLPEDQLTAAREIYDVVNGHMRYSKESTGWGRGDSNWACDSKYGNCSDFHSLFLSLARAQKIPARFEIGFPLPAAHGAGKITRYHCWAWFKPRGKGWVPVDISEANKDPKMTDYFFGNLTADRITLSTGRDIDLVPAQSSPPLNFFIYPHVEVDGKEYPRNRIVNVFAYEDIAAAPGKELSPPR